VGNPQWSSFHLQSNTVQQHEQDKLSTPQREAIFSAKSVEDGAEILFFIVLRSPERYVFPIAESQSWQ
jgi:hypothetical protein